MKPRRLLLMLGAIVAAGCGSSPPTHFFTLRPVASVGQSTSASAVPVQVDAFNIPAVLDRTEMVRQNGPDSLSINDQDHWGAPFGEMARNVLAQDLLTRMPAGTVILPNAPAPAAAAHLVVSVARFGEDADGSVRLDGSWALLGNNSKSPLLRRDVKLARKAVPGDAASQAAAMSDLLGRLADDVSNGVSSLSQPAISADGKGGSL